MSIWPQYALCLSCFEVFNPSVFDENVQHNICPKMSCANEIILVDENLIPIIVELNQKGYYTRNCCSSHTWHQDLYIEFQDDIDLPDPPVGFSLEHQSIYRSPTCIEMFEMIKDRTPNLSVAGFRNTIRADRIGLENHIEGLSDMERQMNTFENILTLGVWVNKLPNIKEEQE